MKKFKYLICLLLITLFCGMITPQPISAAFSTSPKLDAGQYHSLSLKSDGTVWAWGRNYYGQLGNGTTNTNSTSPVQVSGLTGVTSIAAGGHYSLALKSNGTVWAWGYNNYGFLGNGASAHNNTPLQVTGLTGVTAIAAHSSSLALKSNGTVWAWGGNYDGELGNGTTTNSTTPVQVTGLTGMTSIAAGESYSLALKSDGTVWAWGANNYGQLGNGTNTRSTTPVQVTGLTGITSIAAGESCSLALKSDGTVWAWGRNYYGQLGNGSTINSTIPVQVSGLTGVTAIAAGYSHSLALTSDGTAWVWGCNSYGQLGIGNNTNSTTPVQITDLTEISYLAGGGSHSLMLISDGTVWASGDNAIGYSQLGDGTSIRRYTPVQTIGPNGVGYLTLFTTIPVTGLTINLNSLDLPIGEQTTLLATILPSSATNKNVTWASSNPAVVSVDNGIVTSIAPGNAVITVTTADGGFSKTCNVNAVIPVASISLNKNSLDMHPGESETLIAIILPEEAANKNVLWATSDSFVVTVDNGLVTAISAGHATITATSDDGNFQATCETSITVPVESILLNKSSLELLPGDTETLIATVQPNNASNKALSWSSDKPAIASVDETGKITAIKTGGATISATTEDGNKVAACTVKILPVVNNINIGPAMINLAAGRSTPVTITARLADGKIIDVSDRAELIIEDPTIAELDNLTISGLKPGSTNLLTTFKEKTDKALITVQGSVNQSLSIAPTDINLSINQTSDALVVKAVKSDGTEEVIVNNKVQFSIADTAIAGMASDYRIMGKAPGVTVLTVQCNGLKAQTNITISEPVPVEISLQAVPGEISCFVGDVKTLKIIANGVDVTKKATYIASSTVDMPSPGTVLALATGTGNIEVSYNGSTVNVPVTINEAPTDENIMYIGNAKIILTSNICSTVGVKFSITSSNPTVVKVLGNRVFALKEGSVFISVSYSNSKTGAQAAYQFPIQVVKNQVTRK